MKILSNKNVFDAALERINYLFDEFPNVVAGISGGKDSTVIFELTLRSEKYAERTYSLNRFRHDRRRRLSRSSSLAAPLA